MYYWNKKSDVGAFIILKINKFIRNLGLIQISIVGFIFRLRFTGVLIKSIILSHIILMENLIDALTAKTTEVMPLMLKRAIKYFITAVKAKQLNFFMSNYNSHLPTLLNTK